MSLQTDWLEMESEKSTSSLADSPAKTSVLQETGPVCPVSAAACGPSFFELSLKFDPLGQSLRMSLGLELSELTGCSLTWQEQATPLGRWWWVLSMPELRTDDSGFGLLPTPMVPNGGRSIRHAEMEGRTAYHKGKKVQVSLESLAKLGMLLTPKASDGRPKGNGGNRNSLGLKQMAKAGQLTPTARNTQSATTQTNAKTQTDAGLPSTRSTLLPTPTATDAQGRGYQYRPGNKDNPVLTLPGAVGAASSPQHGTGQGRLSPSFVEWMMGYPAGWTDVSESRDLETR